MILSEQNATYITKYPNCFIYFLLKEKDVVYVGQTRRGIERPYSHKDKDWDEIAIIPCKEEGLNKTEAEFILKYKPKYNKSLPDCYVGWDRFVKLIYDDVIQSLDITHNRVSSEIRKKQLDFEEFNGIDYYNRELISKTAEEIVSKMKSVMN